MRSHSGQLTRQRDRVNVGAGVLGVWRGVGDVVLVLASLVVEVAVSARHPIRSAA